jgi:hypothetical protein
VRAAREAHVAIYVLTPATIAKTTGQASKPVVKGEGMTSPR